MADYLYLPIQPATFQRPTDPPRTTYGSHNLWGRLRNADRATVVYIKDGVARAGGDANIHKQASRVFLGGSRHGPLTTTEKTALLAAGFDVRGDLGVGESLLHAVDFNRWAAGTLYTQTEATADWVVPDYLTLDLWASPFNGGETRVVDYSNRRCLRVQHPANTLLGVPSGFFGFSQGYDRMALTYKIAFDGGFDFCPTGGKLPGMVLRRPGVAYPGGCGPLDGTTGASARGMWRPANYPGGQCVPGEGMLQGYSYHMDKVENCGDEDNTAGRFHAGQWHEVRVDAAVNTPGVMNGKYKLTLDGVVILDRSNIRWAAAGVNDMKLRKVSLEFFFGGANDDQSFWHSQVESIYVDDFQVITY